MATFCRCGVVLRDNEKCSRCTRTKQTVTTAERGYDHDWRTLSERIRKARPLCEDCLEQGKVTPSKECHHVVKITDAPHLRLEPRNIVAICKQCHNVRHSDAGGG